MSGPGKFEGEPEWAQEVYEKFLNGETEDFWDADDTMYSALYGDEETKVPAGQVGVVWEDNDGLVHSELFPSVELYELFRDSLDMDEEAEEG